MRAGSHIRAFITRYYSSCRVLRNMAVRPDDSIPRPKNKKRSWKAPEKGSSKETSTDSLLKQSRDDSILQIDGSVLEGVGHVRSCDWINRTFLLRVGRYCEMRWPLAVCSASPFTSQRYEQEEKNQGYAPNTLQASN